MNRATLVSRHVTLITGEELAPDDAKRWFQTVRTHAPAGVLSTVNVTDDTGLRGVSMVHRDIGGQHHYVVPLSRDLTATELERIARAVADTLVEIDFDIEASESTLMVDRTPVKVEDNALIDLCTQWGKKKHDDWLKARTDMGWRYGPSVSLRDKTHPLLLPWEQLPDEHRKPDLDQPQMLLDLLKAQGYTVVLQDEMDRILKLLRGLF